MNMNKTFFILVYFFLLFGMCNYININMADTTRSNLQHMSEFGGPSRIARMGRRPDGQLEGQTFIESWTIMPGLPSFLLECY
jgi:hypothetical protein